MLKTEQIQNTSARIEVLNDKGQIVYDAGEIIVGRELKKEIFLSSSLAAGIYIVEVIIAEKSYRTKLILNSQQ